MSASASAGTMSDASDSSGGGVTAGDTGTEAMEAVEITGNVQEEKVKPTREEQMSLNKKLIRASKIGDLSTALKCVQDGASITYKDERYGLTAMLMAAKKGNVDIVTALLDKGADIEAKDSDGYSALLQASRRGHDEVVSVLL